MTDKYADLREGLESLHRAAGELRGPEAQVAALLAERDRLREALWVVAEHNALHFGESHNTVIQARAALSGETHD